MSLELLLGLGFGRIHRSPTLSPRHSPVASAHPSRGQPLREPFRAANLQPGPAGRATPGGSLSPSPTSTSFRHVPAAAAATSHVMLDARTTLLWPRADILHQLALIARSAWRR